VEAYVPRAYNWPGNVLLLPRERLTPILADSAQVMSFVVTGGISNGDAEGGPDVPFRGKVAGALKVCPQEG